MEAGNVTIGTDIFVRESDVFGTVVGIELSGLDKVGLTLDTVGTIWFQFSEVVAVA